MIIELPPEDRVIKLIYCLHRAEGMSREDFRAYWHERHGPLVRSLRDVLKIRHFVQYHALDGDAAVAMADACQAPHGYDGVAELWWDSEEDLRNAMSSEAGQDAIRSLYEEEARFIDFARSPLWISRERPGMGDRFVAAND